MKVKSVKLVMIIALLLIFLTTSLPGCTPAKHEIAAKLSFSEPPVLEKPVEITFTFGIQEDYPHDAKDATARIIIPEAFELVSGTLEWRGDILQHKKYTLQATIKAVKTGNWRIGGVVTYSSSPNYTPHNGDLLYVSVFEDSAEISDGPLPGLNYPELPLDSESPGEIP